MKESRMEKEQPNIEALYPDDDFNDVFGGPPRSVLSRQYSVEGSFVRRFVFEDMFRKPNKNVESGRMLPEFKIPESKTVSEEEEEFYSVIFGNSRSRSVSQTNSKSKSSPSILSCEELSPFRLPPVVNHDDVAYSSFAANLRNLKDYSCRYGKAALV